MLCDGLYEQIINKKVDDELNNSDKLIERTEIDKAEAAKILAKYVAEVTEKGLTAFLSNDDEKLIRQVKLVNKIIDLITVDTGDEDFTSMFVAESSTTKRAELLLSLFKKGNSIPGLTSNVFPRPETSLAQSSLFTGAVNEPHMFNELKKEILSCDRIDMLVSFIKWSGLRLIFEELQSFTERGGELRIITTSYMGATDIKAIEELCKLSNTKIKVSYDTKRTRLHAKSYIFYRKTGFTTAYVGSSNLSNAAISSGLEWNVKITMSDLSETIAKIEGTFESYWNSKEFEYYDEGEQERLARALKAEKYIQNNKDSFYAFDIKPYSYQQEILDKLEAEREIRGYFKNLVVAATGTGKTIISALDFKRYNKTNGGARLLFVAHREEILKQSLEAFRGVLRDANFGELFVGNHKPQSHERLFISVQTFNSQKIDEHFSADYYDYIILDEIHHAPAKSYQKLFNHFKPKILLGLTATPERMDGEDILQYFDGRIAAEIRLPEAIDRKLLSPFQYFGVNDSVDLSSLHWSKGGYKIEELNNVYVFKTKLAEKRAKSVIEAVYRYVTDVDEVKGLGFCASIEHAEFMSNFFNENNIPSIALSARTSDNERDTAKQKLAEKKIRFIFVVDLYNEGVDIPEINTVLFLRPTESLTVFLQQLGRGLRLSEGKDCLTVLDFIGQAHKKYSFEAKFSALLKKTTRSLQKEIENGFTSLPSGCYIRLEKQATSYILDNLKAVFGYRNKFIEKISSFKEDTGLELNLTNFLRFYDIDPRSLYKADSFSRLCVSAGKRAVFSEPLEIVVAKAMKKFAVVDSRRFIKFLLKHLPLLHELEIVKLSKTEKQMLQMFYVTLWSEPAEDWQDRKVKENFALLAKSRVMLSELIELLEYQLDRVDFIDEEVDLGFSCPLDLHCTYTRDQILVALDFMKPSSVREGVKWLPNKNVDVLFVTLNKSDKDYSPTTMYNDYSINETLFHWQSQSTTKETSHTGERYINHQKRGSKVLLFVRENKTDIISGISEGYTYLGTANYVCHKGEKPMNITWRLDKPIPARFLKKTNRLLVG